MVLRERPQIFADQRYALDNEVQQLVTEAKRGDDLNIPS